LNHSCRRGDVEAGTKNTDLKTVQTLLRHSDVKLTLQFYSHAVGQDRMAAAREMLIAILSHRTGQSGLKAD